MDQEKGLTIEVFEVNPWTMVQKNREEGKKKVEAGGWGGRGGGVWKQR